MENFDRNKIHVGCFFGGVNVEHEISIMSAKGVIHALFQNNYVVTPIYISPDNQWYIVDWDGQSDFSLSMIQKPFSLASFPDPGFDIAFPIMHGPNGEDGAFEGMFRMMNIPCVGPSLKSCALAMDKHFMHQLARQNAIEVPHFALVKSTESFSVDSIAYQIGFPCFVKPTNAGSSIGVFRCEEISELNTAIEQAFLYDHKVLIEQAIIGCEIECAVIGNDLPLVTKPAKIIPKSRFHDYESKYVSSKGAQVELPANLPPKVIERAQEMALAVYKMIDCSGFARIDLFVDVKNELYFNEINPIPGLRHTSLFPRLLELHGINYAQMVDKLICLALENCSFRRSFSSVYSPKETALV